MELLTEGSVAREPWHLTDVNIRNNIISFSVLYETRNTFSKLEAFWYMSCHVVQTWWLAYTKACMETFGGSQLGPSTNQNSYLNSWVESVQR